MPRLMNRRRLAMSAALLTLILVVLWAAPPTLDAEPSDGGVVAETQPVVTQPEDVYGGWVLLPALATIGLAALTRQVLPSLAVGVLVASFMLLPCLPADETYGSANRIVAGTRVAVETYVIGAMAKPDNIKIMVFTLTIGAMVGVIGASGGTAALVQRVSRRASSRRAGQLVAWGAGLAVFFDDYANSMIVGPTMRPIFDRLRISRAKLAYIVDSTAAPVASVALIGTWIGAEIGFIQSGFDKLEQSGIPAALTHVTAYESFLCSLPYRFYPIFALVLVVLIAVTGRDFGPMRKAEARPVTAEPAGDEAPSGPVSARRWWLAGVPVAVLVGVTLAIIVLTGLAGIPAGEEVGLQNLLENADAYASILYAALASLVTAVGLALPARTLSLKVSVEAGLDGMANMFPAIVVLVLAWALSAASQDLHLGLVATRFLQEADFAPHWLPLLIFLAAAGVSFATGTSWGTMGILCPVAVVVAAGLVAELPPDTGRDLFYASVGSVLAGAIFGDHCSPISDTTVLSAAASGCSLEDHVWTQAPYAVLAALVAMAAGNILCNLLGLPVWIGLAVGAGLLLVLVRWLGSTRPFSAGSSGLISVPPVP